MGKKDVRFIPQMQRKIDLGHKNARYALGNNANVLRRLECKSFHTDT